ncbi:MAG: SurA N-terminal domain-containing protein [Verrucomicrobiaceae bacterium]|nr:SurA N-terminal domain-containing protein [Verrucomicrobiaceae bacterium]
MLEFFRRHRGPFLIGLTVLVILAFGVWGAYTGSGSNRNDPYAQAESTALTVYGVDYTQADVARLARSMQLAQSLGLWMLPYEIAELARRTDSLGGGGMYKDYVANTIILREQALKHGVAASEEDIRVEFEKLQPMQKNGVFDPAAAATYLDNLRGSGFTAEDVQQLVKDKIALDRLKEIVGGNYVASPLEVDKAYASQKQTLRASTIKFALEEFKKKIQIKDDEIKKYYDEKKDTFKTAEKRTGQYVHFVKPVSSPDLALEDNAKIAKDWEQAVGDFYKEFEKPDADLPKLVESTNIKLAAINKAADEMKAKEAKRKADEEKKKAEADKKADPKAPEKKPEEKKPDAKPVVELAKVEVVNALERENAPEPLKSEPQILAEIFRTTLAVGKPSDPVESSKGYAFAKVTKIDEPKQQEQKEVSEKIKTTLVEQKAKEELAKAVKDARKAIEEGLKAKKKLAEIAKEKSWKVEDVPEFSPSTPPTGNPDGQKIVDAAGKTAVNEVADPVLTDSGDQLLVIVTGKEVRKSDSSTAEKDGQRATYTNRGQDAIFKAWFKGLSDEAKVDSHIAETAAAGA